MLIDTHNHVGLAALDESLDLLSEKAVQAGVIAGIITAGTVEDFEKVSETAERLQWAYCVGLHPLYVRKDWQADLEVLEDFLASHINDPRLVGIGEIGLDFYVEDLDRDLQERVLEKELELAAKFQLPVSLHSRRSLYRVMAALKKYPSVGGVLHAFSGSLEEMRQAVQRGLYLGFGGAMSYEGSKRVRQAAAVAPLSSIVLETDAPDMPPKFSMTHRSSPLDLPSYLDILTAIRAEERSLLEDALFHNSLAAFPRLKALL
ncbi:MAG TPA: TatD family hydrolase [Candidatus Aphodousia faecigallinarum]|uniref:TatD family hydrolase n=1 Tax=Candidatus Aphodousia faecigallinarum TaxID=2840677 RepID=A0A9D1II74_9BURK|nr:TatD family hydrolase [Candidatus Aphodousia faecigallinarum]